MTFPFKFIKTRLETMYDEIDMACKYNDKHDSDCATHNEPAYRNGECDCSIKMPLKPNTTWLHKNGCLYSVILIANEDAKRNDEYPTTVVYQRLKDKTIWSRPLSKWHSSFTLFEA